VSVITSKQVPSREETNPGFLATMHPWAVAVGLCVACAVITGATGTWDRNAAARAVDRETAVQITDAVAQADAIAQTDAVAQAEASVARRAEIDPETTRSGARAIDPGHQEYADTRGDRATALSPAASLLPHR
jgi:triphosphoribosyl-dephospho-CoA synthetase